MRERLARATLVRLDPLWRRKIEHKVVPLDLRVRIEIDHCLRPPPRTEGHDGEAEKVARFECVQECCHLIEGWCIRTRPAHGRDFKLLGDVLALPDDLRRIAHQSAFGLLADSIVPDAHGAGVIERRSHDSKDSLDVASRMLVLFHAPTRKFQLL
ncbi:MAG TPA: hypothetical protein VH678_15030 [Xanthobacteraceae bacterium]